VRKEENSNERVKRPNANYTLGKENKGWLKLRQKTLAGCCQTSLHILASPTWCPAQVFTFKSIKSCRECFGLCWQSPGQEGGLCVGLFVSFSFKKGALFKTGLPLFSVVYCKWAIMVSSGFTTDYINLQQINYLLAHDCTHTLCKMELQ